MSESIREEVEAMRLALLAGVPVPKPKRPPRPAKGPSRRGQNLMNRPPKYNREDIAERYKAGQSVSQIVKETGAHRSTVWTALREQGIEPNPTAPGPKPREMCGKGLHSMSEHGRPVVGGGRYCAACKADRGRRSNQESK